MGRGVMITGTDTGVGKTYVGCGLARELRGRGVKVAPFKPAETGCLEEEGSRGLIPADAALLREAAGTEAPLETICPYRFRLPVAPMVAAEREGARIEPGALVRKFEELAAGHDWVIVETAGGILVPLNESFHYGDLARRLNLPVIVVAGSKLGVINHTLLTLEYLRAAGLRVIGCVLNHPYEEHSPAVETNAEALRRLSQTRLFMAGRKEEGKEAPVFGELAGAVLGGLRDE